MHRSNLETFIRSTFSSAETWLKHMLQLFYSFLGIPNHRLKKGNAHYRTKIVSVTSQRIFDYDLQKETQTFSSHTDGFDWNPNT